ncbi:DUF7673 family protein [Agrobacterium tumefaciens]|uniref:DUF7673 family protein n=1 Tax=Agrobacterium tumefaciens TaxID=358 RepID=UPI000975E70A|nr:hypothetical protein BV900_22125 [Agrobacterium tumefaciens]
MNSEEGEAFERLLKLAQSDTGRVADFVLAWRNAGSLGGIDLADLFGVDMATVFTYLAGRKDAVYPEEYQSQIEAIIQQWRPDAWAKSHSAAQAG